MQHTDTIAAPPGDASQGGLAVVIGGSGGIGAALVTQLQREGRYAQVLALSRRSIGDNQLGGWYAYRASKAALNQLVHTAAIELRRLRPQALCVALHPGTVDTGLSAPFAKTGLDVRGPAEAAAQLLAVLDGLTPQDSGGFYDYRGEPVPW